MHTLYSIGGGLCYDLTHSHVGNKFTAPGFLMAALVSGPMRNRLAYDLPTKIIKIKCTPIQNLSQNFKISDP